MISKALQAIREQVKGELAHIYRGDFYQNMLREYYFNLRMASLGKKADKNKYPNDKNKILKMSVEAVGKMARESNMTFKPAYEKSFFNAAP